MPMNNPRARAASIVCAFLMLVTFSGHVPVGVPAAWAAMGAQTELTMLVTDGWGRELREAIIELRRAGGGPRVTVVEYPRQRSVDLGGGVWHVLVRAQGFTPASTEINLGEAGAFLPVCLAVSPIELPARERPLVVRGRIVEQAERPGQLWVRLLSLFCNCNVTALSDANGDFVVRGIPPGRYVAMVFRGGQFLFSRQVDVRRLGTVLELRPETEDPGTPRRPGPPG